MSILNIISTVKQIHKKYVILVKVGTFYNCYGKDSYILSYLFGYKIRFIDDYVNTVAFPKNALSKVISKLEDQKINYIILDKRNNYEVDEKTDYKNLNRYDEAYLNSKDKILYDIRIQKIYNFLMYSKDETILEKIEKVINESRKL